MMKTIHNTKIIGIDHGYGNMKTANFCFPTGITAYDHEPLFTADMLVYRGRYYLIGEGHKEFAPDKIKDPYAKGVVYDGLENSLISR